MNELGDLFLQWDLLQWLGEEDYSQLGECYGRNLDVLLAAGLAQIHEDPALQAGFIAKGRGPMFRAVSLTEAGHKALQDFKEHRHRHGV